MKKTKKICDEILECFGDGEYLRHICTGKVKFSYTQRYTAWNNCDYEGCVGGVVHCCEGIQEQPKIIKNSND